MPWGAYVAIYLVALRTASTPPYPNLPDILQKNVVNDQENCVEGLWGFRLIAILFFGRTFFRIDRVILNTVINYRVNLSLNSVANLESVYVGHSFAQHKQMFVL